MSNHVASLEMSEHPRGGRLPQQHDVAGIVRGISGFYLVRAYDGRTLSLGYWKSESDDGRVRHFLTPFSYRQKGKTLYSRRECLESGKTPLYLSHRRICGKGYMGVTAFEEKRYSSDEEIDLILEMEQVIQGAIATRIARPTEVAA